MVKNANVSYFNSIILCDPLEFLTYAKNLEQWNGIYIVI